MGGGGTIWARRELPQPKDGLQEDDSQRDGQVDLDLSPSNSQSSQSRSDSCSFHPTVHSNRSSRSLTKESLSEASRQLSLSPELLVAELDRIFAAKKSKEDVITALENCHVLHRLPLHDPVVTVSQTEKDFQREKVLLNEVPFIPDGNTRRSCAFQRTLNTLVHRLMREPSIVKTSRYHNPQDIVELIMQRACRTSAGADSFFMLQQLLCVEGTFISQKMLDDDPPVHIDVFVTTRPICGATVSGARISTERNSGSFVSLASGLFRLGTSGGNTDDSTNSSAARLLGNSWGKREIGLLHTIGTDTVHSKSSQNGPPSVSKRKQNPFSSNWLDSAASLIKKPSFFKKSKDKSDSKKASLAKSTFEESSNVSSSVRDLASVVCERADSNDVWISELQMSDSSVTSTTLSNAHPLDDVGDVGLHVRSSSFDLSDGDDLDLSQRSGPPTWYRASTSSTASPMRLSNASNSVASIGGDERALCARIQICNSFAIYDVSEMDEISGDRTRDPPPWLDVETVVSDESDFLTGAHCRRLHLVVTDVATGITYSSSDHMISYLNS